MEPSAVSKQKGHIIRGLKIVGLVGALTLALGIAAGVYLRSYIINHSEEWIGRKVEISSIFLNPWAVSITVRDLRLFEPSGDSVFVSFDKFFVNASLFPLFNRRIELEEVTLTKPFFNIVIIGDSLNFDDLITRFASDDSLSSKPDSKEQTYAYVLEDLAIEDGAVSFFNSTFHGALEVIKLNAICPQVSSDKPSIEGRIDFELASGGEVMSSLRTNLDSENYDITVRSRGVDIGFALPFIDKVMYITAIHGKIDTDLKLGGKFDTSLSEAGGTIQLINFEVLDTLHKPSVKIDRLDIQLDTVSALAGNYNVRSVHIDNPYLKFDITPYGNSLLRSYASDSVAATGVSASEPEASEYLYYFKLLGEYFIELGQAYSVHSYSFDSLRLSGGNIEFNDYTLNRKFNFLLEELSVQANKFYSNEDSLQVFVNSKLNRSGILDARLTLMPRDTGDMALEYSVKELKVSDFSPYSEYYVAHPFWDGVIDFTSHTTVVDNYLDSKNHLFVAHLEVGDKVLTKTAYDLPLKLAVSLLKDVNGNVDLKIPVKGNVDDPKFRVFPVVLKILKDLIIKAAATPYKALARTFDANEEDLRDVKYDYLQSEIKRRQAKSLNQLAHVLNQKEDLKVTLVHMNNVEWEKTQYAIFESKLKYFCHQNSKDPQSLTLEDSIATDRIARLDSGFVNYLQGQLGKEVRGNVEDACIQFIGPEKITSMLQTVNEKRVSTMETYLSDRVKTPNRFTISEGSEKEKESFHEIPRFVIRFEAGTDSTGSAKNKP